MYRAKNGEMQTCFAISGILRAVKKSDSMEYILLLSSARHEI